MRATALVSKKVLNITSKADEEYVSKKLDMNKLNEQNITTLQLHSTTPVNNTTLLSFINTEKVRIKREEGRSSSGKVIFFQLLIIL